MSAHPSSARRSRILSLASTAVDMRVSVHVAELDLIVNVDVSPDCTVADLKAAVAFEFPDGDPRDITRAKVLKDAKQIPDASSLRDAGVA